MKFGAPEYREVALAKVVAPGDTLERQKRPHVVALAASIRELGDKPHNAIVARKVRLGWEIIEGRDRFSALLLNGAKKTWIHVVEEATPLELLKCEIHENLHRRHDDKAALTRALIDRAEDLVRRHVSPKSGDLAPAHRPETPRGEGRRIVAEAEGVALDTVIRRDQRAKAREEGAPTEKSDRSVAHAEPPPIETWDLPISDELRAKVVALQAALKSIAQSAAAQQATAGKLDGLPPGIAAQIRDQAHALGALARAAMPTHLCPYCKGNPDAEKDACRFCKGALFARAEQMADVPPELLNGTLTYAQWCKGKAPGPGSANLQETIRGKPPKKAAALETCGVCSKTIDVDVNGTSETFTNVTQPDGTTTPVHWRCRAKKPKRIQLIDESWRDLMADAEDVQQSEDAGSDLEEDEGGIPF